MNSADMAADMAAFSAALLVALVAARCRPGGARGRVRGQRAPLACRLGRRVRPLLPMRGKRPPIPTAGEWATVLDAAAAEVRSGASLTTAWQEAQRRHPCVGTVIGAGHRAGTGVRGGVGARGPGTPGVKRRPVVVPADEAVVVQVLGAAAELGGPVAATLDAGASLLRERVAAREEALAHSAQARLSARVLTAVPVAFAAWSAVGSASFRAAVLTPAGTAAVALGGALNLAGWWWMRRVVARVAA